MSLREQIEELANSAMKEHKELELGLFRMIKSAVKNTEIEKGHELTDEEVLGVLEKQAKQRRDSIQQYQDGGRQDLADKETAELKLIEALLPEKMSEEEVRQSVRDMVSELSGQDFGRVMGAVMAQLKGKADGALVQKIVKEEMGQ